ncbi:melanoma-associated antigen B10-like [Suncus etruscus]|uniref:melanoma-associated antigen B10-like n=1 Tax=Suncus etruscus TaxID=109475 RepID=UPI00210FC8B9|nr:melanoma-associated antigen B10-like [Suncus etruscus]
MPWGHKSKNRAREKCRQAHEEIMALDSQDLHEAASASSTEATNIDVRSGEDASGQEKKNPTASVQPESNELFFTGPLEEKVAMLVHFLLYKYYNKEPVTKAEMIKNVIQTYKSSFPEILKRATEHIELIFGIDVKEIDTQKHIYVLINKLDMGSDSSLNDDIGIPKTGLLMTILTVIFTKGNHATEQQVWQTLNVTGLHERENHLIFGDTKKLITINWVQQKYLDYRQVPGSDPHRYEFLWGSRAYEETSKMKVLENLAKVCDTVPSAFPIWYEDALKEEEERAKVRAASKAAARAVAARERSKAMVHPVNKKKT